MHAMQARFVQRMNEANARNLESSFLDMTIREEEGAPNDMLVAVAVMDTSSPAKTVKLSNLAVSMRLDSWKESLIHHRYKPDGHKAGCASQGELSTLIADEAAYWAAQCSCGHFRVFAMNVMHHWHIAIDPYTQSPSLDEETKNRIADQSAEIRREWLVQWRTALFRQKAPAGLLPLLCERFPHAKDKLEAASRSV